MKQSTQIGLLLGLLALGAWLWFSRSGSTLAKSAGEALATGVETIMELTNSTLRLLKRLEGFSAVPYQDAKGYSIGYGHFIQPGETFTEINVQQATQLLKADLAKATNAVKSFVKTTISQNQFDALTSFVYNIGATAFANSTLLKKLNAGDIAGASMEFSRWNKSQGVVIPALVQRRQTEATLFLS